MTCHHLELYTTDAASIYAWIWYSFPHCHVCDCILLEFAAVVLPYYHDTSIESQNQKSNTQTREQTGQLRISIMRHKMVLTLIVT